MEKRHHFHVALLKRPLPSKRRSLLIGTDRSWRTNHYGTIHQIGIIMNVSAGRTTPLRSHVCRSLPSSLIVPHLPLPMGSFLCCRVLMPRSRYRTHSRTARTWPFAVLSPQSVTLSRSPHRRAWPYCRSPGIHIPRPFTADHRTKPPSWIPSSE